jgi:putative Mg2+ transporter-C (MgtC) family protein
MTIMLEDVIKLLLAVLIGGLVGAERKFHEKAAGFRTILLICIGATLFTIFSFKLGGSKDPVRIAAYVVVGIGFLGAGVILAGIFGLTEVSGAPTRLWRNSAT